MIARCKTLLGTFVEIKIEEKNFALIDAAFAKIQKIHNLMSFFDEKSEVSLLNHQAHLRLVKVSAEVFEVLNFAKNLFEISGGIFDITLHRSQSNQVSAADIELQENFFVKFKKPLQIDLGGIAKGFAVDQAAQALENQGIVDYIINAGGDLRVGKLPKKINVRNPKNPQKMIAETEICDGALATSSGYFSCQEVDVESERKAYPIFAPQCGALEFKGESVSVFAKSCMAADALTKITLILGGESSQILTRFDAQAMVILENKIDFFPNPE